MKANSVGELHKEYTQFVEEEKKVNLLREEGGRLWRANEELKREITRGEKKMDDNKAGKIGVIISEAGETPVSQEECREYLKRQMKDFDKLIARHKATLDLLAKPAPVYPKTTPFLRAALDAEAVKKIVDEVEKRMAETMNEHKPEPKPAKVNKIRTREVLRQYHAYTKYVTYTWPKSAGDRIPDAIVAELAERIKAPSGPEECGCIDKAGILYRLKSWKNQCEKTTAGHIMDENYADAYRLQIRGGAFEEVIDAINEGDFDRAPGKPEPAPSSTTISNGLSASEQVSSSTTHIEPLQQVSYTSDQMGGKAASEPAPSPVQTGEVVGFTNGKVLVKLKEGGIKAYRGTNVHIQRGETPYWVTKLIIDEKNQVELAPSKPALDKESILDTLKSWATIVRPQDKAYYLCLVETIKSGAFDLPAPTAIKTADLVEILRGREGVVVDITDLDAGEMMTYGNNKPSTVIAVTKEENKS